MKTTVDIDDELLARARETAKREGTTLRALVEEALRVTLAHRAQGTGYHWPDLSVGGDGIDPALAGASLAVILDLA